MTTEELTGAAALPAGHSRWVGYRIEGEVPSSVVVTAQGEIAPGATRGVDIDLGETGADVAAMAEVFWPPQPR